VHGSPIGAEGIEVMKDNFGWPSKEPFFVPAEVYEHYDRIQKKLAEDEEKWNALFEEYKEKFPDEARELAISTDPAFVKKALSDESYWNDLIRDLKPAKVLDYSKDADATRNVSG
jgi:transketolase